jgi:hypothetical protein
MRGHDDIVNGVVAGVIDDRLGGSTGQRDFQLYCSITKDRRLLRKVLA